jgi:hypothetical protein
MCWYVGPDGTVYEHLPGVEQCYESPNFIDLGDCGVSQIHLNNQFTSRLDNFMKMRETEARIKQEEAKAAYMKAKAENEKRKNNPWFS